MLEQYLPETSEIVSWGILVVGVLMLAYAIHPSLLKSLLPWRRDTSDDEREVVLQKMQTLRQLLVHLVQEDHLSRQEVIRMNELSERLMQMGLGPEKSQGGHIGSWKWLGHLDVAIPYVEEHGIQGARKKFKEERKARKKPQLDNPSPSDA